MKNHTPTAPRRRILGNAAGKLVTGLAAASLIGGGIYYTTTGRGGEDNELARGLTATVGTGPLTISIQEKGTVRALNPVVLASGVEGRITIIELAEEGTEVRQGDVVVRLDSAELEDRIIDLEIEVENASADLVREQQDLAITLNQTTADITRAELDVEFARIDLRKYWAGEYPNQRREAQNRITLAAADLEQAQDQYDGSVELFENNFISFNEKEADRLRLQRAELDDKLAVEELALLEKYTRLRTLRELMSDISQAELALDRERRRAESNIVQAEASVAAQETQLNRLNQLLDNAREQLDKCVITAPVPGTVVYPGRSRWEDPIQEGSSVRQGEELVYLPNSESMMVEVSIHETYLDRVRVGQPAVIELDALPGRTYRAVVAKIAGQPDSQTSWLNPDLVVYATEIHFDERPEGLRSGMTGTVEILIDHFDNALQVPVQAVVARGGKPTVWVVENGKTSPQAVTVGMDNDLNVMITSGLEEGQVISLVPPLDQATQGDDSEAGTGVWTGEMVTAARDAFKVVERVELSQADQELMQTIQGAIDEQMGMTLEGLLPDDDRRAEALAVVEDYNAGREVEFSSELRDAVETGRMVLIMRSDFLKMLVTDEALQAQAAEVVARVDAGEPPAIPSALKDAITTAMQRMSQGRGRGGRG